MLRRLKEWRRDRVLQRRPLPDTLWHSATGPMGLLQGLTPDERLRLRRWTTLFLAEKEFYGAQGFPVSEEMKVQIAVQACLLILNLDLDCYRGWTSVVIYPESFVVEREDMDEAGIVHAGRDILSGESWEGGPVVISWAEGAPDAHPYGADTNVVIHELAHKLDMQSGSVNGLPPLPGKSAVQAWAAAFGAAYEELLDQVEHGRETVIDPYAAESPGEFFAVVSECFFEAPWVLRGEFPAVYEQLANYYRQDPAARRPGVEQEAQ